MKHVNGRKNRLSALILMVLVAAMVLSFAACGNKDDGSASSAPSASGASDGVTEVGQGEKSFSFEVYDADGVLTSFLVHTDADNVGDALSAAGLIEGEEGAYGLYVKTVNGLTVDYDKDGKYWAFYINGEYASTSVDLTELDETAVYSFKVE